MKHKSLTRSKGITHITDSDNNRKNAFTLAEVLITLGIIGVVASLTIPNLIKNYQRKAWTTQLQKSYSMLEQSFQKMLADEGVSKLSDTKVWASKGSVNCSWTDNGGLKSFLNNDCKDFLANIKNYIKIIEVEKYNEQIHSLSKGSSYFIGPGMQTEDAISLILSDGTMLFIWAYTPNITPEVSNAIKSLGGNMRSNVGILYIDVNGRRGPNTFGRDIFYFYLSDEGKLYPNFGKDYAFYNNQTALSGNNSYWRNNFSACGSPDNDSLETEAVNGSGITYTIGVSGGGCAARIMENGWKMDY